MAKSELFQVIEEEQGHNFDYRMGLEIAHQKKAKGLRAKSLPRNSLPASLVFLLLLPIFGFFLSFPSHQAKELFFFLFFFGLGS